MATRRQPNLLETIHRRKSSDVYSRDTPKKSLIHVGNGDEKKFANKGRAKLGVHSIRTSMVFVTTVVILIATLILLLLKIETNIVAEERKTTPSFFYLNHHNHTTAMQKKMVANKMNVRNDQKAEDPDVNQVGDQHQKQKKSPVEQNGNDNIERLAPDQNDSNGIGKPKAKERPLESQLTFDDPPVYEAPIVNPKTKDFDPHIPGVVVTKIQGPPHLRALRQMLCLFTKAYNNRANRDIIVFTSEAIDPKEIEGLNTIVAPAKLIVEIDNPGLQQMVESLSPKRKKHLLERCHVNSVSELTWYTRCTEEASYKTTKGNRIAYGWQAEFRALWIWTHPILKPYKYMMWMDSDAFCTRVWNQDPIATMERHDLALLFDHFPQGSSRGKEFPERTKEAFDRIICDVSLVNGTLVARDGKCIRRPKSAIHQVHGFFHVSSLDFYRSDAVMKWNRALIGDSKFSRLFDDQIAITIPAAVLAGNRSWDMRSLGVFTRVFHNYVIDGRMQDWRGYFVPWWESNANTTFPEASQTCFVEISG